MALPWNELLLAVSEVRKALQHWTSLCRVHPQEPRWCSQNKQIHNPRAVMYVIQWCFRWVTLRQRELLPIHRAGHVILTRWDDIRARRSEHRELTEAAMMGLAHGGSPDDKRKEGTGGPRYHCALVHAHSWDQGQGQRLVREMARLLLRQFMPV